MPARERPLDAFDRRILEILQGDNTIPNIRLAEMVGLSPPACSRRAARLRREGVIVADVSLVDPQLTGNPISVVITVTLENRRTDGIEAFQRKMLERAEVRLCFMVAGSVDFMVVTTLRTVEDYTAFATEILGNDADVKSYESWFVLRTVKQETRIPIA